MTDTDKLWFNRGWNAAIKAAEGAVTRAPVFPTMRQGPAHDGELLRAIEICRREIAALVRVLEQ